MNGTGRGTLTVAEGVRSMLADATSSRQAAFLEGLAARNSQWFDAEVEKLYRWSEDVKLSLETEIKDLDREIRELRRASALAQSLQDKLTHQKEIRELERRRTNKRRELFTAQDEIDARREDLIGKVEAKLQQACSLSPCSPFVGAFHDTPSVAKSEVGSQSRLQAVVPISGGSRDSNLGTACT